ncbi:GNAT family N-acetyltransferase [Thiohalobacter thiocyanaticus]|uniref:GNAT family N-acetyltransferase n=1 Tax=Thiohalobacter thiocyanaticus TaxID=585455 RepID=A0A426QDW8_9GAMM|nr:GNAT family N-acetyltransferase [Thiohalobacter thiocyanaticus]RRQ19931.1 GNAT family N-acetyltransferase [Thiohalobacter thiocyanaticus]
MKPDFHLSSPCDEAELKHYFDLRWQLLRAPWDQPRGSERDEFEDAAFHLQVQDRSGSLIGIGRLHRIDDTRGQIRYMAVVEAWRGRGVGTALLEALEQQARDWSLDEIRLHARQAAVDFYAHHGYSAVAPSHTLFGSIPHFLMRKPLP